MAKMALSPATSLIALVLFSSLFSGEVSMLVNADWCIVQPSTLPARMQQIIDFCCGKVNCRIIKPGGSCFTPNTLANHASVAMNLYYKRISHNCANSFFGAAAEISVSDPSFGRCRYE